MNNSKIENVVFITIDSLRFDRIGGFNNINGKTPNIDFLAKNGISCINTSSHGCPTQIAMPSVMSSTLPLDHGGYDYGIKKRPIVLAEVFKQHQYNTTAFCSGSALTSYYGYNRGFENFFQFTSINLIWYGYRKLYYQYFLSRRVNGDLNEKDFQKIIYKFLDNLFSFIIEYCNQIKNQIKNDDIIFDKFIMSTDYKELEVAVLNEKKQLNNNYELYISERMDNLNIKTMSYNFLNANQDIHNFFLKKSSHENSFNKIQNYIIDQVLKKIINKLSLDWIHINRDYEGMSDDETIINNAFKWLNKNYSNKMFLWLHMIDLHSKKYNNSRFQIPAFVKGGKSIFQKNSDKSYDLSLYETDKKIGRIIKYLKKINIFEKTLIVISSDHGHDAGSPNRNLGIGSASFYEEYVRIPLCFYNPGIKHKIIKSHCCAMDIAPTILDLMGINIPNDFKGYPVYSKKIDERKYIYMEHTHRGPNDIKNKPIYICVKSNNFKLIWKEYIYDRDQTNYQYEMYDLKNDPHEEINIYKNKHFKKERTYLEEKAIERYMKLVKERK